MFLWLYFPANIPVCICPCIKTVPLVLVLLHVCSLVTFRAVKSREKCVLLVDDVLTTGATFIALRRKLIAHGAKFVIGIFLAKTIAFEDGRKE